MLNQRLSAVHKVRAAFLPAEQAQLVAALSAAQCVVAMLEAQRDGRLPLDTGLTEVSLVNRGAQHALEARKCFIEAHAGLAAIPGDLRIPARAMGDTDDCPPYKTAATLPAALSAVA